MKFKQITIMTLAAMLLGGAWGEEEPELTVAVSNVVFRQRYPWNGLVDIECDVSCSDAKTNLNLYVTASDNAAGKSLVTRHVWLESDATHTNALEVKAGHHRLVWDAGTDNPNIASTNVTIGVQALVGGGGVQLWEDGPYWAECNVGASKPEDYGYYFWWGDTVGYKRDGGTWTSGYYYSGVTWVSSMGTRMGSSPFNYSTCPTFGKYNSQLQSEGYIDSTGNLVAAHDAATAHLGAPWRIPTDAEWSALLSNCDTQWTSRGGVYGRLVTGRGAYASKSIFLPAAGYGYDSYLRSPGSLGYYWSSTPDWGNSYYVWYLYFRSSDFFRSNYSRGNGQSVRPLRGFAK